MRLIFARNLRTNNFSKFKNKHLQNNIKQEHNQEGAKGAEAPPLAKSKLRNKM